jgi:hypothetical protein
MQNHACRRAIVAGLAVSALTILGTGCATVKPMALSKEAIALEPQQALAIATVNVANVYKTGSQPHVKSVLVKTTGEKSETLAFQVVAPFRASELETNQFEEILVSMALAPGAYELTGVQVAAGSFIMPGNGMVPLNAPFQIAPGKSVYLGRIEAVRRERKGDEPRAGPVIPLIDQAVTGFSGGTFDVRVVDRYDQDLLLMRNEFPPLRNLAVEKQLVRPAPPAPPAQARNDG